MAWPSTWERPFQSVFLEVKDQVHLYYTLCSCKLERSFKEILNKCTEVTNENWYGEKNANVSIGAPGMCPCPILSSLWGQQLITFEATPRLVSHLCRLLFSFDWQQFKATPCLVSHLPFAPLLLSPPWCNTPPCQFFGLPPSSTGLATLRGDAEGCQSSTFCPFLGKSLRKHTNSQSFALHHSF